MGKLRSFFVLALLVFGQGITETALADIIAGRITDARTGEELIGANVFILETGQGASTNLDGEYIILNVGPGTYTLRITYVGYQTQRIENVVVRTDLTTRIDVAMQTDPALSGDEVVVIAEQPLIRKDETATRQTISGDQIKSLPVQNFADVVSLQSGVVSAGRRSFNVRGGRSNEVAFMVDGIMVRDPVSGTAATNIGNDMIEELTLLSGTFNAEYGNAMSGVVNITTREGGNTYRGLAEVNQSFGFINEQSDTLFGRPASNLYAFRLDGPIIRDRLSFLISAEHYDENPFTPFGYDNGYNAFAKFTLRPRPGTKLNFSGRYSQENYQTYNHSYKYIPDSWNFQEAESFQGMIQLTQSLTSRMALNATVSYFWQDYFRGLDKPVEDYLQSVTFRNPEFVGEFYASANPTSREETTTSTINARADLIWAPNNTHEIKAGVQFQQFNIDWFEIINIQAVQPYITDVRGQRPYEGAIYVQDKIEQDNFVLNIGLRFDFANQRSNFRADPLREETEVSSEPIYQFSPRIGISHPISANSILRFSYGRFFQNPDFRYIYENNFYEFGTREPLFGSPDLDAQRTTAYEFGLIHQFSERAAVTLSAYYKDIRGLIGTEYIPQGALVNDRPAFTSYSVFVNEAYANVRGFELSTDLRLTRNLDVIGSYTYSIAKGSASSELEGFPRRLPSSRLYFLDFDKRHLLNIRATLNMGESDGPQFFNIRPFANSIMGIVISGSSGYPYTPTGRDIGFVDRNSERYPITYTVDVFASRSFTISGRQQMSIFTNITNLTNRRNVRNIYTDTGRPDEFTLRPQSEEWILNPSNWFPPRTVNFGIRYTF
ncbi:MAG: TonB-dependent receptor [Balneolales bacterium]|nr:TonB-dependent receptor [Balneolales bacterium]